MRVLIGGQKVQLRPADVLGVGGEATVYRWGDRAVKIYHPMDPGLDPAEAAATLAARAARLQPFVQGQVRGLPPGVVVPEALVTDLQGTTVGFAMQRVEGADELRRLADPGFRAAGPDQAGAGATLAALHALIGGVHAARAVVGDLNDGNVLWRGAQVWLIDADGLGVGGRPCPVAHERFLDPRLFGLQLGLAPVFSPDTDWYAFTVMVFQSLLLLHPYGGVAPGLNSLLRRAEARHSALKPDVRWPRQARDARTLPDALIDWFKAVFDADHRGVFPRDLLALRWTRCACGLEHARARCPVCTTQVPLPAPTAVGGCTARLMFRCPGRLLAAAWQGGLRVLHLDGGALCDQLGTPLLRGVAGAALEAQIAGDDAWIRLGEQTVALGRGQIARHGAVSALAANASGAVGVVGDGLVRLDSGLRLGAVMPGQTRIFLGARRGFGLYPVGRTPFCFLFWPDRPGLRDLRLPLPTGRIRAVEVAFDDTVPDGSSQPALLVSIWSEAAGQERRDLLMLSADGALIAHSFGRPDEQPWLAAGGAVLAHGRALCPTDEGLVSLKAEDGQLVPSRRFPDTAAFVSAGDRLLAAPGGAVLVVRPSEVLQLSM